MIERKEKDRKLKLLKSMDPAIVSTLKNIVRHAIEDEFQDILDEDPTCSKRCKLIAKIN